MEARQIKCPDCDPTGRRGGCAPNRCYCGHKSCWAYHSYVDLGPTLRTPTTTVAGSTRATWETREEETWIDRI